MTDYRQKSWWLQSLPQDIIPNQPLDGSNTADVTIIGGGYTGLSTAYHLKTLCPQLDVCLLESDICGYGASGRNGGFSMTLFGLTKGITAFRFDDQKARSAHLYMQQAVDYLHDFINTHNIECDYEQSGYLLAATSPAQVRRIEHDFSIMEKWGLAHHVQRWDKTRLNQEFKTNYYRLGWFEPGCGILNPAKLARGLKQVAEKTGAVIFEQSPVTGFYRKKDKTFVVTSPSGRIQSRYLVFATNAYSVLFDKLSSIQRPAFTHIVMTEPLTDAQMQSIGWQCRAGIEDARDLIHYYRLTKDNRIVMGGGDVSLTYGKNLDRDLNEKTFAHLKNHITQIFPQLAGIGFTHQWGGPVSVTLDMAPVIGYLGSDRRAIFSLGCIGHGVSMTTQNGRTIAELICNQHTERTNMFFVGRKTLPWPAEPLAFGLSQTVRGFMKLEDMLYYR